MRTQRTRWVALVAVIALVAVACGDGDTTDEPTEPTPGGEDTEEPADDDADGDAAAPVATEGELVIWADEARVNVLGPFAEEFSATYGVEVVVQELEFGDIRDRVAVAGPAGEGPDIFIGAHDWLGQLVASGVVAPLDLVAVEDDLLDVAVEAFTFEGVTYGLPYAVESIALVRNTALVPEAPTTFEELEEIALALEDDGTVSVPLALQWADPYHAYPLFTGAGGYVFGRDAEGYDADDLGLDSDGGLEAAQRFAAWLDSGLLDPDITYDVMIESFGTGDAPFAITGPWAIAQAENGFEAMGIEFVVEPIPPIDGQTPRPFVGVQGFMVSAFAADPVLAQTFVLEVMATEDAQVALFEAGGRAPALASAFELASADPVIAGFGASGADGDPMPAIPAMSSVWEAWTSAYTLIGQGEDPVRSFEDAANQIRNLIDGV